MTRGRIVSKILLLILRSQKRKVRDILKYPVAFIACGPFYFDFYFDFERNQLKGMNYLVRKFFTGSLFLP